MTGKHHTTLSAENTQVCFVRAVSDPVPAEKQNNQQARGRRADMRTVPVAAARLLEAPPLYACSGQTCSKLSKDIGRQYRIRPEITSDFRQMFVLFRSLWRQQSRGLIFDRVLQTPTSDGKRLPISETRSIEIFSKDVAQ